VRDRILRKTEIGLIAGCYGCPSTLVLPVMFLCTCISDECALTAEGSSGEVSVSASASASARTGGGVWCGRSSQLIGKSYDTAPAVHGDASMSWRVLADFLRQGHSLRSSYTRLREMDLVSTRGVIGIHMLVGLAASYESFRRAVLSVGMASFLVAKWERARELSSRSPQTPCTRIVSYCGEVAMALPSSRRVDAASNVFVSPLPPVVTHLEGSASKSRPRPSAKNKMIGMAGTTGTTGQQRNPVFWPSGLYSRGANST